MTNAPNRAARTRAERQREYRRRQRQSIAVYRVAAGYDVLEALLASRRLTEEQALDRKLVETEVAAVLAEWARRWREQ